MILRRVDLHFILRWGPYPSDSLPAAASTMRTAGRRRSWNAPFLSDLGKAEIGQEILAGVMGWQTVVTSLEFCEYCIHRVSYHGMI